MSVQQNVLNRFLNVWPSSWLWNISKARLQLYSMWRAIILVGTDETWELHHTTIGGGHSRDWEKPETGHGSWQAAVRWCDGRTVNDRINKSFVRYIIANFSACSMPSLQVSCIKLILIYLALLKWRPSQVSFWAFGWEKYESTKAMNQGGLRLFYKRKISLLFINRASSKFYVDIHILFIFK